MRIALNGRIKRGAGNTLLMKSQKQNNGKDKMSGLKIIALIKVHKKNGGKTGKGLVGLLSQPVSITGVSDRLAEKKQI